MFQLRLNIICCLISDYDLLKKRFRCKGEDSLGLWTEEKISLQDCADFCRESAWYFAFGTTEFGRPDMCNGESCKCQCHNDCPYLTDSNYWNVYEFRGISHDSVIV